MKRRRRSHRRLAHISTSIPNRQTIAKETTMNLERAVTLRECALAVVKAHGAWESVQYGPNSLAYREGALTIAYRSPFQKLPALIGKADETLTRMFCVSRRSLSY